MVSRIVTLGRIVKAHGIRGEVAVEPWLDEGEALSPGARVWLKWPEGKSGQGRVETARPHGKRWLIRLEGIADRTGAEALVQAEVRVDREDLPPLGEDEYLWEDLIGLEVRDESGRLVGRLVEVFSTGPWGENAVIVVQDGDHEILLPMTREVIREVDLQGGRMKVSVPAGLRESNGEGVDL
ncbi:MAG: ribosome maturation factor RimM [Nitrospinota bacterium]